MAKIKGIDLVNLRRLLQKQPPAVEKQLIARLNTEEQILYFSVINTNWNPVELQNSIYIQAGEVLYPQDKIKYINLGRALSEMSYTSIYKIFLRILEPKIVVQHWKNLWRLHHNKGIPSCVIKDKNHYQLIVENYPDLPLVTRQLITGHVMKIIELVGIKKYTVSTNEDNPENWCWDILWKK